MANAAAIIIAHNHSSASPTPPHDHIDVTRRLVSAGACSGSPCSITSSSATGRYYSFKVRRPSVTAISCARRAATAPFTAGNSVAQLIDIGELRRDAETLETSATVDPGFNEREAQRSRRCGLRGALGGMPLALTPNSAVPSSLVSARAATMPTTPSACRARETRTPNDRLDAPSAMRMPISCVLCLPGRRNPAEQNEPRRSPRMPAALVCGCRASCQAAARP
jgi:hypothetical protein